MLPLNSVFKNNIIVVIAILVVIIVGNILPASSVEGAAEHNSHLTKNYDSQSDLRKPEFANNQTSKVYAERIFLSCKDDAEHCPMMALDELNKMTSPPVIMETFSDLVQLYDENNYSCHHEGHHLGMWLYDYTGNLSQALNHATVLCGGSVYHGIFQAYFGGEQFIHITDKDSVNILNLCPVGQLNVSWLQERDCIHGIGHGLVKLYNYDTVAAADRCNEFVPLWAQSACSRGVYMENYEYFFETGKGDIDRNDIYFPCNKADIKFAPQCYYYFPGYDWDLKNVTVSYNLTDAYAQCDNISPGKFAKYCYQGIGRLLATIASTNPDVPVEACNIANQSMHKNDCLVGTLKTILKGDGKTDVGFSFCGASNPDFKPDCYEIMGMWIKTFLYPNKQDWVSECSKALDDKYVVNCLNANPDTKVTVYVFEPV